MSYQSNRSSYLISENTRLINSRIDNLTQLNNFWTCTEFVIEYDETNNDNTLVFSYVGDSGITTPPIDIDFTLILMEVLPNAE